MTDSARPMTPMPTDVRRRSPAIPVLLAFWAGVVADAYVACSGWAWLGVAAGALLLAGIAWLMRQPLAAVVCLLIGAAGAGAVRHHDSWSVGAANDIGLFASDDSKPARLIGSITQRPIIIEADADESPRAGRSRERMVLTVQCRQLRDGANDLDVTGAVRVNVSGAANEFQAGDEVELFGRLQRPDGPRNVGEFDFPEF